MDGSGPGHPDESQLGSMLPGPLGRQRSAATTSHSLCEKSVSALVTAGYIYFVRTQAKSTVQTGETHHESCEKPWAKRPATCCSLQRTYIAGNFQAWPAAITGVRRVISRILRQERPSRFHSASVVAAAEKMTWRARQSGQRIVAGRERAPISVSTTRSRNLLV